jgi:hypothetical protein
MRFRKSSTSMQQMSIAALLLVLTVISGLADAQGFIHASSMWQNGKLIWPEVMKSAAGFGAGIVTYGICIRFLQEFKIFSPEIQTIIWFTVTIIGVAIVSGKFLQWRLVDQIVGVMVILSVAWLLIRAAD